MASAADYRKHAQDCIEMAERLPSVIRPALLEVARIWLQLAVDDTADEPDAPSTPPYSKH